MTTALAVSQSYRTHLLAQEQAAQHGIEAAHQAMQASLAPHLALLYRQYHTQYETIRQGNPAGRVPLSWLYRHLESLLHRVSSAVLIFAGHAWSHSTPFLHAAAQLGSQSGTAQLHTIGRTNVTLAGAALVLSRRTQAEQTVQSHLAQLAHLTIGKLRSALVVGVTLGMTVNALAKRAARALDFPRWQAQSALATQGWGVFRGVECDVWTQNDPTLLWVWFAEPDACPWCLSQQGSEHPVDEEMDTHVNCFPAGTIVSGPRVLGSTTRWYSGEIIDIETANGNFLTVTPNHPILTPDGWVAAGNLNEGSYVVSSSRSKGGFAASSIANPDDYQVEAPIEQVATTFGEAAAMVSVSMPTAPKDFHGDGLGSEVHIIRTYSHLRSEGNATLFQPFSQQHLGRRGAVLPDLAGFSDLFSFLHGGFSPTYRLMSGLSILGSLFSSALFGHESIGLSLAPYGNASFLQSPVERIALNTERFSESIFGLARRVASNDFIHRQAEFLPSSSTDMLSPQSFTGRRIAQQATLTEDGLQSLRGRMESLGTIGVAFASEVCADRILKVNVRRFSGHVYNLQSTEGWYIANNIITHNCRCQQIVIEA